jgi:hypothetical protein
MEHYRAFWGLLTSREVVQRLVPNSKNMAVQLIIDSDPGIGAHIHAMNATANPKTEVILSRIPSRLPAKFGCSAWFVC